MTTIEDVVTYIDGRVANGKIILTWPIMQVGGVAIAAGQQEWPVVDGQVSITVYPTINSQPVGVYYTATYELDEGAVYDEFWIVPGSATGSSTVTIATVRAQFPTTPSVMINAQQITSSGAQPGMILGWNGANWTPMFVSSFNAPVQSVFGRSATTGQANIVAQTGDYSVEQVTGAVGVTRRINTVSPLLGGGDLSQDLTLSVSLTDVVPGTRQIIAGYGLSGGGPLTSDVTLAVDTSQFAGAGLQGVQGGPLSVVPNSTNQQVQVASGGTLVGTRHEINFIAGPGTIVNVGDDGTDDRVNVTVSLSGTGPASPSIYAVNGGYIGTEPELNLIAGANTTISGVDNGANSRVDVTIQATGGTSYWQPGTGGVIYYSGGNVGIGTATPGLGAPNPARTYLSICGSTGLGVLEFLTNLTDADGAGVGQIAWTDKNSTAGDKRISLLYAFLSGPTANNRGGVMAFYTKADGGSSTERMRLDNTGRLGLGTTVPAFTLDIAGDCNITGTYRVNGVPLVTGGYWQAGSGGAIYYSGGNVGIGTASPAALLDVAGLIRSTSSAGASGTGAGLELYGSSGNGGVQAYDRGAGHYTQLNIDATPLLLNATTHSNVGIGIVNPQAQLHIAGAQSGGGNFYSIFVDPNSTNGSSAPGLVLGKYNGVASILTFAGGSLALAASGGNVGIGTTTPAAALQVKAAANEDLLVGPAVSVSGAVCLSAINDGNSANVPLEIRSSLTSFTSGFVGIGATNPSQLLTVVGSPNILASFNGNGSGNTAIAVNSGGGHNCSYCWQNAGASQWYLGNISSNNSLALLNSDANSNAQVLTILQSGQVGIGTTSPGAKLDVAGAIVLSAAATGSSAQFWIGQGSAIGSATLALYAPTGSAIEFGVANSFKMVLTAAGRLGIGTVSPGQPLTVQADASANAIQLIGRASDNVAGIGFFNSAQSAAIYIYSNAAGIGINTSTPAAVLDVAGQIRSSTGGYKFPDNTVQTTAAVSGTAGITQLTFTGQAGGPCVIGAGAWTLNFTGSNQATTTVSGPAGGTVTINIYSASDVRAKQNIETLAGGLGVVAQIRPVRAEWNGALGKPHGQPLVGVVAQEIAEVLPEAVYTVRTKLYPEDEEETDVFGLEPIAITAHLILAVQQLQARIEELERRRN